MEKQKNDVSKMKRLVPDQFHCLVKMHLSFLLDLSTDDCNCEFLYEHEFLTTPSKKKGFFSTTPKKKNSVTSNHPKGVMEGGPLTFEGVCQVFQIIEYLKRPTNLKVEGLFRKHGNLKKQQTLKERLNKGIVIDLDSGEFSVHECASTLKTFLSDLPEPVLTDAYYKAHCQVATMNDSEFKSKKIQCLQLLFLLIPEANYRLLQDLIQLLSSVIEHVEFNKMNALNLATVFATHIICPRKMAPDCLQSNHQLFIKAISFMIENSSVLFNIPDQLAKDVEMFFQKHPERELTSTAKQKFGPTNSPVVNTYLTFVDREKTKAAASTSTTETALAELYAQVQAMPESAQKKRLISKLNDANGCGTPLVSGKKRIKPDANKLKNLLTPKSKGHTSSKNSKREGRFHGSYSLRNQTLPEDTMPACTPLSTFKRQDSENESLPSNNDGSPELRERATMKPPKPQPPPRVSSLKTGDQNKDSENLSPNSEVLHTPRCRKPIMITDRNQSFEQHNSSSSSSYIRDEANEIICGTLKPSDSMVHFLDGGNESNFSNTSSSSSSSEIETALSPNLRKNRKRSITELGGPNPLAKSTPTRNCENVYFETDL